MSCPITKFYCTNLKGNDQRWNDSLIQFAKVGLEVERFECIPHENRFLSFNHTMIALVKKGYETGQPFGIFEDDVALDDLKRTEEGFSELPEDWDLWYWGANIFGVDTTVWQMPDRVTKYLHRLHNAWQSHAIIYSNKAAKWIIENFDPETFPVYDEWLRINVMSKGNVYLQTPMVAYQRPVWSDLWEVNADYTYCHLHGNKILK